ncbi:FAD-dependent oxidoreductase [uncultured Zhongshania sp.]|mgnify:FL=1|uniref:FAD-dependent oxidoreductase n=1 Tax=uncultured Zhongshania sp. TaxID=1642288 RepID=UPI0030DBA7C1|tara:strand:- start:3026 stop:5158 length:2133 start_codon:yes stop_codon:yes gene_type:complete
MIAAKNIHYPQLFSPGKIGNLALRNRIVMAAMGSEFANDDGSIGERLMDYYEARAAGGVGLIVLETSSVSWPKGAAMPNMIGFSSDAYLPALTELTDRVHRHGCKIAAQLNHSGKVAQEDTAAGRPMLVPSVPHRKKGDMFDSLTQLEIANFVRAAGPDGKGPQYKVMDRADIEWAISKFVAAARRTVAAGFDAIELHCGHGYLISSFLSPYSNRRDDEYGGDVNNRARFLLELIAAIKAEIGNDFPIICRLDAHEFRLEGGIRISDTVAVAKLLEVAGCHAIDVSAYADVSVGVAFTEGPLVHTPGGYIEFATELKAAVSIPVIAVGRIEAAIAERHIAAGDFDFVAMGRKLLADPELPNKLLAGREDTVRPCIYCYVCVSQIFINEPMFCAVNPGTGREAELGQIVATKAARRILVVGGGPAGMEAARVLSLRGHQVSLWERDKVLGGTARVAALAYEPNGRIVRYLKNALAELPVNIELGKSANSENINAAGFDTVILATGARRRAPDIAGKQLSHVLDGEELRDMLFAGNARGKLNWHQRLLTRLSGALGLSRNIDLMRKLSHVYMPLGKRVCIIGGGLVGLEVAELLAERGRQVTVLEAGRDLGAELSLVRRWRVLHQLKEHGVELHRNAAVREITADRVMFTQGESEAHTVADNVIIAVGAEPDSDLRQQFASLKVDLHSIGDSAEIGYIEGAIRSARELAVSL